MIRFLPLLRPATYAMVLGGALAFSPATLSPVNAQQSQQSSSEINNRLERLERDLQTLNRQVYRGQPSAPSQTNRPAGAVTPLPQGYATEFEVRLQGLESAVRNLTGQIERIQFDVNQLSGRFDRAMADVEFRLEQGNAGAPASAGTATAPAANSAATAATAASSPDARVVRPNTINNVNNTAGATVANGTVRRLGMLGVDGDTGEALPADGVAGQLSGAIEPGSNAAQPLVTSADVNPGGAIDQAQTASVTPVAVTLPDGDAQTQYDFAFDLLKQYQVDAAADARGEFLNNQPTDPLAANAQFWLGETHFVNGDYREAAVAFATGYEKFPQAEKGSENLLKLGMSLGRLGQKQEACLTLIRLGEEYPDAPGSVKQQALAEQRDLGCGES